MSTPFLYTVIPALFAVAVIFLRKKSNLTIWSGMGLYLLLGLLAFVQRFGEVVKFGPLSVELRTSMLVFGRSFVLGNPDRYFLVISCVVVLLWLGGIRAAGLGLHLVPYMVLATASLTAAVAVNPFLYSAIFVEMAVLFSMPLLINSRDLLGKGVLRFLIFQSLSMPLILLGGWFIAGNQASPSDLQQLQIAAFFLGVGFAFWLAVFPLHSWVPQLAEDVSPYLAGFVLTFFPQVALLLMIDFTTSIAWIRESAFLGNTFLSVGTIMLVAAAVLGLVEKKVHRLFGDLILFETGALLLLIGIQTAASQEAFYLSLVPRFLAIMTATLCLAIINPVRPAAERETTGSFWNYPFASMGLLVSSLSIIGFPPFGEFPFKFLLVSSLATAAQSNLLWVLLGFAGMLLALLRTMSWSFLPVTRLSVHESWPQIALVCIGVFLLLLIGIFPGVLSSVFANLIQSLPAGG